MSGIIGGSKARGSGIISADLAVADGGTGASTLTSNYALLGNGTSAPQMIAPGTSGNVLTSDGSTWASAGGGGGIPSNLVAYRASGQSTPSGWSEYTSARGRMIVGLPSGGTDGGTVGTALTDTQDKRKAGGHVHTGPSHTHSISLLNWTSSGNAQWDHSSMYYGTSGTFTSSNYLPYSLTTSGTLDIPVTALSGTGNTGSGGVDVDTSDVLAYIQLMTIKKD
jgi:hypothetical protein